jgi:hypothetical protein
MLPLLPPTAATQFFGKVFSISCFELVPLLACSLTPSNPCRTNSQTTNDTVPADTMAATKFWPGGDKPQHLRLPFIVALGSGLCCRCFYLCSQVNKQTNTHGGFGVDGWLEQHF